MTAQMAVTQPTHPETISPPSASSPFVVPGQRFPTSSQTLSGTPGGYAQLADFMSSDRVFLIFRSFDRLSSRNILCMQAELCKLEARLEELDRREAEGGNAENLGTWIDDNNEERRHLLLEVREKMGKYREQSYSVLARSEISNYQCDKDEAIKAHADLVDLGKPQKQYSRSLLHWLEGKQPLKESESHFLDNMNDVVSLLRVDERLGPLDTFLEKHFSSFFSSSVR